MMLRLKIAVLPLIAAVALAACGGSGGATKTPTVPPAAPTATIAHATAPAPTNTAAPAPSEAATATSIAVPTTAPDIAPTPVPATEVTETPATPAPNDPPGAAPTVVVGAVADAVMQYYDVTGVTAAELRASMNAQGPLDSAGQRNDAFTTWNIDWTWPLNPDSSCVLSGATITTTITVTFPRWLPPADVPASLVERWNDYEAALVTHESGHVSFVVTTANDVLAAIKGATCDTAEAAAQAVVLRIRQHDADYDAETNHGATQGAHFP
jgi:predicted secreted Zn-dependent protease